MLTRIPCTDNTDCFANNDGYCVCLMSNDFKGRKCPFYKEKTITETECTLSEVRLLRIGRKDLIEMYLRRMVDVQK